MGKTTFAQHRFVTESGCSVSTLCCIPCDPTGLPSACLSVDGAATMHQTTLESKGKHSMEILTSDNKSGDNQVARDK